MPVELPQRCRPDSILEFRTAARLRMQDGVALLADDRPTTAIYLWGYAAEMILKAAYFDLVGFAHTKTITGMDLNTARTMAKNLAITWPGNLHYLLGWTELLIAIRASVPDLAYADTSFASAVRTHGSNLQRIWSATLRYHKNRAYRFEANKARAAAEWLIEHDGKL